MRRKYPGSTDWLLSHRPPTHTHTHKCISAAGVVDVIKTSCCLGGRVTCVRVYGCMNEWCVRFQGVHV